MISRTSSTPVCEAASISITSTWRLSMIAWQCTPSAGMVDGRARHRAVRQFVVERAGEDAGGRGLADAAHAGEHEGLRDAAGRERVRERAHHRVLADQVVEGRGPVFARQHAIGRRRRARASRSPAGSIASWPSLDPAVALGGVRPCGPISRHDGRGAASMRVMRA